MQNVADFYKDFPESIKPSFIMKDANEEYLIYQGEFFVEQNERQARVDGKIKFCWFPTKRVLFLGVVKNENFYNIDHLEKVTVKINGDLFGEGRVFNRSFADDSYTLTGYCNSATFGDKSTSVEEIIFSIPNLRDFIGGVIKTTGATTISSETGRMYFEDDRYIIIIDKISDFDKYEKELLAKGGYINLYGGKIKKKKGAISLSDFKNILYAVCNFLYFFNGRRTSPLFMKGLHQGEVLWEHYSNSHVDPYKSVRSWTYFQPFDDLSKIWKKFSALWKEESDRDFLNTVIHWYVEANSEVAFLEGSIILAQTALELIYNWLIIEQKKMIVGNDADGLSASNKIRLILSQLNTISTIPENYLELIAFSKTLNMDYVDAPEVLTRVRNSLIHGQEKKRKDLRGMDAQAKYQALQIALWYIELSILKILDYNEKYWNRVAQKSEIVPWGIAPDDDSPSNRSDIK